MEVLMSVTRLFNHCTVKEWRKTGTLSMTPKWIRLIRERFQELATEALIR